jgi:O-antigen ligase
MSTYGGWSEHMPAHNDLLEHFAEDGIAGGIALVCFMVAALTGALSRPSTNSVTRATVVSSVLFALAGAIAFRLPFLALLAIEGNRPAASLGVHDMRELQGGKAQEPS